MKFCILAALNELLTAKAPFPQFNKSHCHLHTYSMEQSPPGETNHFSARQEIPRLLCNFATSTNLVVKSTMLPHRNIHKYTWTFPDGKTHKIDHILRDRRWHSIIRSFKGDNCDTNHCLVVAKLGKDWQ